MMVKTGCTCAILKLLPDISKKGSKCITEQVEREKKDIRFHHHHYIVSPI